VTYPIPRQVARVDLKSAGGDSGNRTRDRGFAVRARLFVSVRRRTSRTQIWGARTAIGHWRAPKFVGVAVSGAVRPGTRARLVRQPARPSRRPVRGTSSLRTADQGHEVAT